MCPDWYLLCEVVQFVVQVRGDAVVLGYQGNSGTDLLAGQPEAVGQRCRQRPVLVPLSDLTQTEGDTGGQNNRNTLEFVTTLKRHQ